VETAAEVDEEKMDKQADVEEMVEMRLDTGTVRMGSLVLPVESLCLILTL
jgi:hypothetical protein